MKSANTATSLYCYSRRVTLVDVRESAQQTSSLCVSLFRALGADAPIRDIDSAHRVPMRQASGGPRPVIVNLVAALHETRSWLDEDGFRSEFKIANVLTCS